MFQLSFGAPLMYMDEPLSAMIRPYFFMAVRSAWFAGEKDEISKLALSRRRIPIGAALAFEEVAALHARLDKLAPVLQQMPEAVHRIDQLHALIVQKCVQPESVALFRVDAGAIAGPFTFPISDTEHGKSQSMEARIQAALAGFPPAEPHSAIERMEHLAILKRWCYRGSRAGEIFFADGKGELPMRRIVRGISRVYKGEPAEPAGSPIPEAPATSA